MKIDKKNPRHILALTTSAINSVLVSIMRPILKIKKRDYKVVVFYGHTLNGNLKVFYDYLLKKSNYKVYFLALDKDYFKRLKSHSDIPETILLGTKLKDMLKISTADAIITSHGLHLFTILRYLTNIKFIDVWHAVSYKGFGKKEFNHLHSHDQIWVSSEAMRELYIDRYKFERNKVKITGYARTDLLINKSLNKNEIIKKYSIPFANKYVLLAPTWRQDLQRRNLLPFGMEEKIFFKSLDNIAQKHSAHFIFRTHLNSSDDIDVSHLSNISFMPYSKYEVVEDFLFLADILVTDWSSIGIDYLPLKRPTIFLDVPAPFKNGFNLGPDNRFGDVVNDFNSLKKYINLYLENPKRFIKIHDRQIEKTIKTAYGLTLDGKSCERYFKNLELLLSQ